MTTACAKDLFRTGCLPPRNVGRVQVLLTGCDRMVLGLLRGSVRAGFVAVEAAYSAWAWELGLSKRQVFRSLAHLQQLGFIERRKRIVREPYFLRYAHGWRAVAWRQLPTRVGLSLKGLFAFAVRPRSVSGEKSKPARRPARPEQAPALRSADPRVTRAAARGSPGVGTPPDPELEQILDTAMRAWEARNG